MIVTRGLGRNVTGEHTGYGIVVTAGLGRDWSVITEQRRQEGIGRRRPERVVYSMAMEDRDLMEILAIILQSGVLD